MPKINQLYQKYKQIIAYLFWGVLTTLVDLITFGILVKWAPQINPEVKYGIAWFVSTIFAYFTNRKWVFHSTHHGWLANAKEITSFMIGRAGSLLGGDLILWFGVSLLGFNSSIGQNVTNLISQVFVVIVNYFWSKLAVFKSN